MLSRILAACGLSTAADVMGFLICGMLVLPAMLSIGGELNAAVVVVLLLFNALLVVGIGNRELGDLGDDEGRAAGKAGKEDGKSN